MNSDKNGRLLLRCIYRRRRGNLQCPASRLVVGCTPRSVGLGIGTRELHGTGGQDRQGKRWVGGTKTKSVRLMCLFK